MMNTTVEPERARFIELLRQIAHLEAENAQLKAAYTHALWKLNSRSQTLLISVAEAAERANVPPSTIYRHLKREVRHPRWTGKQIGSIWMVYTSGIDGAGVGSTGQDGDAMPMATTPPSSTHNGYHADGKERMAPTES